MNKDCMTREQYNISQNNKRKAIKYFESIYPWFKNRKPYEYCLHHKDESLRHTNLDRYILWLIEDLEIVPYGEHSTEHNMGNTYGSGPRSEETRKRISAGRSGMTFSDEHKRKLSDVQKGRIWYTNGVDERHTYECPEGWWPGRKPKKGIA